MKNREKPEILIPKGIPERKKREHDATGYNARAEALIGFWSDTESPIRYGGSAAYYSPKTDEIHLPQKEDFVDMPEYYSTALRTQRAGN